MSSVHIDKGSFKFMFGKFTRKSMKQELFDAAVKENPVVGEVLTPKDFGLKSVK